MHVVRLAVVLAVWFSFQILCMTIIVPEAFSQTQCQANGIQRWDATFDWILIDSAPLLPIADAEIISRISDGTIIVVRRDKSPKTALKQALERVAASKMIGFLLNGFPTIGDYADARYSAGQRLESWE